MKALHISLITISMIVLIIFLWMAFIFYQIIQAMHEIIH